MRMDYTESGTGRASDRRCRSAGTPIGGACTVAEDVEGTLRFEGLDVLARVFFAERVGPGGPGDDITVRDVWVMDHGQHRTHAGAGGPRAALFRGHRRSGADRDLRGSPTSRAEAARPRHGNGATRAGGRGSRELMYSGAPVDGNGPAAKESSMTCADRLPLLLAALVSLLHGGAPARATIGPARTDHRGAEVLQQPAGRRQPAERHHARDRQPRRADHRPQRDLRAPRRTGLPGHPDRRRRSPSPCGRTAASSPRSCWRSAAATSGSWWPTPKRPSSTAASWSRRCPAPPFDWNNLQ